MQTLHPVVLPYDMIHLILRRLFRLIEYHNRLALVESFLNIEHDLRSLL